MGSAQEVYVLIKKVFYFVCMYMCESVCDIDSNLAW